MTSIGLAVTGVGLPLASGLEIVSLATGLAVNAIDCRNGPSVQCGLDTAATALGVAGVSARVPAKYGTVGKETADLGDTIAGIYGQGFAIPGVANGINDVVCAG